MLKAPLFVVRQLHLLYLEALEVGDFSVERCEVHCRIYLERKEYGLLFEHLGFVKRGCHKKVIGGNVCRVGRAVRTAATLLACTALCSACLVGRQHFYCYRVRCVVVAVYVGCGTCNLILALLVGNECICKHQGVARCHLAVYDLCA